MTRPSAPSGTPDTAVIVRVQTEDFDVAKEIARLQTRPGVGALVTFTGICRDEDGRLSALELEHYPGMAEAEIQRIVADAAARWPLAGVTVIHRYGRIPVGDRIVLVVTAASHRQAAFESASFLMDFLKTRAPFWKKEHSAASAEGAAWVAARTEDDDATGRW